MPPVTPTTSTGTSSSVRGQVVLDQTGYDTSAAYEIRYGSTERAVPRIRQVRIPTTPAEGTAK
jgi:hypothetical protein